MLASVVTVVVIAARLLVPLLIPRFPLPGLIGALVLDAIDQSVFSAVDAVPSNYQSYDKALDVYYLSITYASTLRNWRSRPAFRVARFLWYYRLVGTVAFELTGAGWLLLVFPNVFEYAVIAYEAVRLRYDPTRMSRRTVLAATLLIWVVIKLPQEFWIHVANLDLTDELSAHPGVWPWLGLAALALAALAWLVARWLPAPDWPPTFNVDKRLSKDDVASPSARTVRSLPFWSSVGEKVLLLGLISVIFAQILPVQTTNRQLVLGITVVVLLNGVISQVFAMAGTAWSTPVVQFLAMLAINGALVAVLLAVNTSVDARLEPVVTAFFLLLLSLLITLYDRYRAMREHRLGRRGSTTLRYYSPDAARVERGVAAG